MGAKGGTDARFALVYEELRRIARRQIRVASAGATLCTTELVHEAFLKLAPRELGWENEAHFLAVAAQAMRQVLVDFARRRYAAKRGGGWRAVTLGDEGAALDLEMEELLALDAALDRLDQADPRLRQVVELRFFGGVTETRIAELLGVSTRTVERDWLKARLFLLNELRPASTRQGEGEDRA